MKKFITQLLLVMMTTSILLAACTTPQPAPPTVTQVQATQTTVITPALPVSTQAPTATPLPTYTAVPTQIITPTQTIIPTAAPSPLPTMTTAPVTVSTGPTALVNENTNCRSGPSTNYPVIVVISKGVTVTIVSKTTLQDYVLVGAPNNTSETCWLWTQYVTINGDLSSLPVATPPPPLLSFNIVFNKIEKCSSYMLEFEVTNTGPKTLQAYKIVAKDLTANSQQTSASTLFDLVEDCAVKKSISYVDASQVGYAYASNFTYDPTGHSIEATITICSHDDMTGVCATQLIKVTP